MPPIIVEEWKRTIQIWFVGIECDVKQESVDEIFGTVSVIVPSTRTSSTAHFPSGAEYISMGEDGTRTVSIEALVYEGPPTDVVLQSVVVEHDSGNLDEYRRRIAEKVAQAASGMAQSYGVPSEAVAANQGWINDLSFGLINVLSGWAGADDDPYTPQALRITAYDQLITFGLAKGEQHDMPNPFPVRSRVRPDTPGVKLKYDIDPVHVSGTDQGGDTGHYTFYYSVELKENGEKIYGALD